ncbi:regucalcin-like, partial [Sitodiplosis mosellana]|uniref:regucalcin-like n=1 Tax=Sitodiplosis mosellana TaxID=263140 RepID=UPI002443C5DD
MSSGSIGHSVNSGDFSDYDYDIISMPDGVGTIGIMDSPFYDCKTKSLYFVDLFNKNIYRYSEENNRVYYCSVPGFSQPSFFIPVRGKHGVYSMGQNTSIYEVGWDGFSTVCNIIAKVTSAEDGTTHHTNAAIARPKGALHFGYYSQNLCGDPANQGLYRWQKKSDLERLPGSYVTVNSMGFDYKRGILYVSDGCTHTVRAFKVNKKTGKISQPWVVVSNFGLPNSVAIVRISVDKHANLAIGTYKGGKVFFVNSRTGQIMKTVDMPTLFTAAVAYGGCDFSKLYVMTAQLDADITTIAC